MPYHLAIALKCRFSCDRCYYITVPSKMQVLFLKSAYRSRPYGVTSVHLAENLVRYDYAGVLGRDTGRPFCGPAVKSNIMKEAGKNGKEENRLKYQYTSRVRFSEAGTDGCITIPAIFDYFQDGITFQEEQMGHSPLEIKKRNRVWVTAAWQVVIARRPTLGEEIVVTAIPYKVRGFVGLKNMLMESRDGERLAWANSSWGYLNYTTGMPEKLTEEDLKDFEPEPKLDMEYAPRRISEEKVWEDKDPFPILKRHLDTNSHVNNCQYIHMACDYLPETFKVRQVRAEYRKQSRLGDVFYPAVCRRDNLFLVCFFNESREIFAITEFSE